MCQEKKVRNKVTFFTFYMRTIQWIHSRKKTFFPLFFMLVIRIVFFHRSNLKIDHFAMTMKLTSDVPHRYKIYSKTVWTPTTTKSIHFRLFWIWLAWPRAARAWITTKRCWTASRFITCVWYEIPLAAWFDLKMFYDRVFFPNKLIFFQ